MTRQLREVIDANVIAENLEKARRIENGSVVFDSTWFEDLVWAFAEIAPFADDVSEFDRHRICTAAIFEAGKSGVLTKTKLFAQVDKDRRVFERQTPEPYVLVTSIAVRYSGALRNKRIGKWKLRFLHSLPKRFDRTFLQNIRLPISMNAGRQFTCVLIFGPARSDVEAFEGAIDALDYVRGMWNLSLNRRVWTQHVGRDTAPVNQITLGPIHTLHRPDGKPATARFWYEPNFQEQPFISSLDRQFPAIANDERFIRRMVRSALYGSELRKLLVRYCRALDSEATLAFLHLWGVLEGLSDTVGARYDETIRRAVFLYHDPVMMKYVLELLRHRRNQTVHAGLGSVSPRDDIVRLNRYVTAMFKFALEMGRDFKSLEELGSFLSLPDEQKRLERDILLRRKALRFKGYLKTPRRRKPIVAE